MNARRTAALTVALLLAGCGGGGGSTPATPHAAAPAATPAGAPVATAKLTIKFPSAFFHAKAGVVKVASSTRGASTSGSRKPAYVNPGMTNVLDIFVNGQDLVEDTLGDLGTQGDGSLQIAFPFYSVSAQQIVVVETDSGLSGNIIGIGETDLPANSFSLGGSPSVSVALAMNALYLGLMSDPGNGNNDATVADPNGSTVSFAFANCGSTNIFPFAADTTLGFAAAAGLGSVIPGLTSWTNMPGSSTPDTLNELTSGQQGVGYAPVFNDLNNGGIQASFSAVNPANVILNDYILTTTPNSGFTPGTGSYPSIERLANQGVLPLTTINSFLLTGTFQVAPPGGC